MGWVVDHVDIDDLQGRLGNCDCGYVMFEKR